MTGIIFDVDGTLVDTTYLHGLAWWRAFREAGEQVPLWRCHRLIGMGSDQLVPAAIGRERPELSQVQSRYFAELKEEIRAFPRAADLLRAVKERGAKVVLATSAKEEDVEDLTQAVGADDAIDELVFSGEVEASKPEPEIFTVALDKAGLRAGQAIVVGDTVWDVQAARRAGMGAVGLRCGGFARQELEESGALAVYDDPADLLAHLDESPLGRFLGG